MTSLRTLATISAVMMLVSLAGPMAVFAQSSPPPGTSGARPRIEVRPAPRLLYRRCAFWYELQYRPSGTVLFPARHCWWVRG